MNKSSRVLLFILGIAASSAIAQVTVTEPWVRATVPQQKATGAFMKLTSAQAVRVLEARSPIADVVEIHEMKMENNVMKMRAVPALELAAGTLMELKPGGYHVMLIGLKQQIKEGEIVPITLVLEGKDKKQETIEINALVRPLNTAKDEHHGHKH